MNIIDNEHENDQEDLYSEDDIEEYHFADDDDEVETESYETVASGGGFLDKIKGMIGDSFILEKIKGMAVPLVIGGVFLIFCIYKLMGLFSAPNAPKQSMPRGQDLTKIVQQKPYTGKQKATLPTATSIVGPGGKASAPTPKSTATESAQKTTATQPATQTQAQQQARFGTSPSTQTPSEQQGYREPGYAGLPPMASPQASPPQSSTEDKAIKERLHNLEQQQQRSEQEIGQIQQTVIEINSNLSKINTAIAQLAGNSAMQARQPMVAAPSTRSAQQATVAAAAKKQELQLKQAQETFQKKQKQKALEKKSRVVYHVQAIIPGRAWLKSADGMTITVVKGNRVPGYGRVTQIDSDNGIVRTSDGTVFGYAFDN